MEVSISKDSLMQKYIKIFLVVCLYWVISISMVFLNKHLLGGAEGGADDAPLFITWFQCLVTVILCIVISKAAPMFSSMSSFPHIGMLQKEKVIKVLPLTVMFTCMITFNNLCLKNVGVAFYYVGRSLSTVFNVVFSYIILGQTTPCAAIACCGIIVGGFLLGVDQEGQRGTLTLPGIAYGVVASAAVSLNSIFTKKVLPTVDDSVWQLSYYNNAIACVLFMPVVLLCGEGPAIYILLTSSSVQFWVLMISTGVCGLAIGYVTGLQIQVTSPLTHTISGTAKACAQTVLATTWFNEVKSGLWWFSNASVLMGSLGYTRVKQQEMKEQHKRLSNRDETASELLPK